MLGKGVHDTIQIRIIEAHAARASDLAKRDEFNGRQLVTLGEACLAPTQARVRIAQRASVELRLFAPSSHFGLCYRLITFVKTGLTPHHLRLAHHPNRLAPHNHLMGESTPSSFPSCALGLEEACGCFGCGSAAS